MLDRLHFGDQNVHAIGFALDMVVDPLQFGLQLFGRKAHRA